MNAQVNNNLMIQGRLVWGSNLFEGNVKTEYGTNNPMLAKDGVTPIKEYSFGLAIPKIDPATGQNSAEYLKVWKALHDEAFTLFPNGQLPPDFALKFKDGDGIDHNGKNFADREGYAGHIILNFSTRIPVKYFIFEGGNNILVNSGIKIGDYVNVQTNIKAHPAVGQGKAGLYVSPTAVQLIQAGKEIINTPSGDSMFGQAAPAYNGQVVADVAPQMPNVALQPGQPINSLPQVPTGAPPAQQPPAQQPPTQPNYGVLPPNHQPNQGAGQAPTQVPSQPPMQPQAPAQQPMQPQVPQAPQMPGMP